MYTLISKFAI